MNKTKQIGFYLDVSACIGCKTCMAACKDKNDLPVGTNWRKVLEYSGGNWQEEDGELVPKNIFAYYITLSCQHCEEPPCVANCPALALTKNEKGIVQVNPDLCVGCQYCLWVCPYGTPQFQRYGEPMSKCDFCSDLLALDQNPACVDSCPLRALEWGNLDELKKKHGDTVSVPPMPDKTTKPAMILTKHSQSEIAKKIGGEIMNLPESKPGKNSIGANYLPPLD